MFRDAECWINKEGGKVAELADRKRAVEMDRQILSLSLFPSISPSLWWYIGSHVGFVIPGG